MTTDNFTIIKDTIVDILRLYCGFLQPLSSEHVEPLSVEDQKTFRHLFNDRSPSEVAFSQSPLAATAFPFLRALYQASTPEDHVWDISETNPEPLSLAPRLKALRRLKDNLFVFDFEPCQTTVQWKLGVTTATDALFLCRLPGELTELQLLENLLRRGIAFRSLPQASLSGPPGVELSKKQHYPSVPGTPFVGSFFSPGDFEEYERRRTELLKNNPRIARAALLRGGILWRLTVESLGLDGAFRLAQDAYDANEELSSEETVTICGVYVLHGGAREELNGNQDDRAKSGATKVSWWPLDRNWSTKRPQSYWTQADEAMYLRRRQSYLKGENQPRLLNTWREKLRSWRYARIRGRRLADQLEKYSLQFVRDHGKGETVEISGA